MKRLFLAIPIDISNEISNLYVDLQKRLAHEKQLSWANLSHTHLTLKFIGSTPAEAEPKIIEAVTEVLKNHHSFSLVFNQTGLFGSRYAPRVIWLGMQQIPPELTSLEEDLLEAFDKIGFLRDSQNFIPHLTLARIGSLCEKQYFQKVIQSIEKKNYIQQEVRHIVLYQSILRPEGPIYRVIKQFDLQ